MDLGFGSIVDYHIETCNRDHQYSEKLGENQNVTQSKYREFFSYISSAKILHVMGWN